MLWQLPPTLPFDADRLAAFLGLLPRTTTAAAELARHHDARLEGRASTVAPAVERRVRHVLEVRHASFARPELAALLREHAVGLVVADTAGRWPFLTDVTSDLVYVRLHGDTELYTSGYDDAALARWAGRVRRWSVAGLDVHVYFDNDAKVHAPFDAIRLRRLLDAAAPSPREGVG